jgi:hypothetical protein
MRPPATLISQSNTLAVQRHRSHGFRLLQHSGEDVLLRVVSASVVPPSVADAPDAPL